MAVYAYIRVSTKDQKVDRQMDGIKAFQIPDSHVFCDYQSGRDFNRPAYQRLKKELKRGDLLVIKSIDRLGRNYEDILIQWQSITKEIGADIYVLDMELLDTRKKDGNLTGALIADMVLQILAYVAQTEREFIHQRQAEGIAAAKARGIKLGRSKSPIPQGFDEVCLQCYLQRMPKRTAASILGMSLSTFYRRYNEWKQSLPMSDSRHFDACCRA